MAVLLIAAVWLLAPAVHAQQPAADWIRVAVVENDPQVELEIHGHFKVLALQTGDPVQEGRRLQLMAVRGTPQGLSFGDSLLPWAGVRVEPLEDATISLNGIRLRGTLEIIRRDDLSLLVVNYVLLEDYLRGVLSKEAPDYWPPEALKAIAIAARTYALYQRLTKEGLGFDVTGNVLSQLYGGKTGEKDSTDQAVKSTRGSILVYHGRVFPAFYHSTCGGLTENGRVMGAYDIEPLQGGQLCRFCSASPFYRWRRWLTNADVNWALRKSAFGTIGAIRNVQVTKRTASGRAEQITISGADRTLRMSGYDFRALFGFERIRSPMVSITPHGEGFVIEGQGWGHGVGLCQWGAAELARRGVSAPEILSYYYPRTAVVNLNDFTGRPMNVIQE